MVDALGPLFRTAVSISSQDNGNGKLVLPQLNRLHEAFTPVSGHRADFTATGMRSQRNQSDPFRFNHSAFWHCTSR
jgi:hypothetical protein